MAVSVSELSRSRPGAEQASSNKPGLLTSVRRLFGRVAAWPRKLVSSPRVRVLVVFVLGFAAGLGWHPYGDGIRRSIAGWSPHLAWVAPSSGSAAERLRAASVALANVRQSVDKLSTEIGRLQTTTEDDTSRRRRR